MNKRQAVRLAAAVLCVLAASCGSKATSDSAIKTDIQSKLYADATTKAANIAVDVNNGAVTLSGDVPTPDVEQEAVKVANTTTGVKNVSDQMKVAAAAATPPPPAEPPPAASAPPPAPVAAAAPPPPPAAPPAPRIVRVTIPAGQSFSVRTIDPIDSKTNSTGQSFRATLNSPLTRNGRTVIPSGGPVTLTLTNVKGAGRIKGSSEIAVTVTSIDYHGRAFNVDSSVNTQQGNGRGKQTAVRTGIGAAAGALIGGLAGGGKGAGIGALAGGGAGVGFQAFTHGQQVKIPSESIITFTLNSPLTVERTEKQ